MFWVPCVPKGFRKHLDKSVEEKSQTKKFKSVTAVFAGPPDANCWKSILGKITLHAYNVIIVPYIIVIVCSYHPILLELLS